MTVLKDMRVLELASVLAGPSVGQFFAELGAEVIKVENLRTGGDVTRTWKAAGEQPGDLSAYFCSCNWGKKSVAVDLATIEGKKFVAGLASKSDIVIASYKPGDAEKLGVSYAQLAMENSKLIYGQITGYGSDNDRVGYDAVIQAESGFMDLNGDKGGPPVKMPVALIDVLAAHHLKEGILLALLQLQKTGKGSMVEVSLIQAAVASLVNQASNWLVNNTVPSRQGSSHPNISPYGDTFETKDGKKVLLAIGNDRQFNDLMAILDLPVDPKKFSTNQRRVVNRVALNDLLAMKILKCDSTELLKKIHQAKIPAGVIQNIQQAFLMPEVQAMLIGNGALNGVRSFAATSSSWEQSALSPPPHFGQHNAEFF